MIKYNRIELAIIIITVLFCATFVFAGEKQLTFEWTQEATNLPTLDHWTLYKSTDLNAAWPWEEVGQVPYDGTPGSVYTAPFTITVPDGEETNLFFKMTATDNLGQPSGPSEMQEGAPTLIDFLPPDATVLEGAYDSANLAVSLSWSASADAAKWEVYKKEASNPFIRVAEVTEPSYIYDASADVGKTLTFAVVTFDAAGNYSPNSNTVAFPILPVVPSSPFGLKVTISTE